MSGKPIRHYRLQKGLKQARLAPHPGIKQGTMGKIGHDKLQPSLAVLLRAALVPGCSAQELLPPWAAAAALLGHRKRVAERCRWAWCTFYHHWCTP